MCFVASSPSLFLSWVGLELNTLAFIPLLLLKKSKLTSEASIKYFLTQTLASVLILIGGLLLLTPLEELGVVTLLLGLRVKLGAAPFHGWVLSVAEASGWGALFLLLTIQKINPLLILWVFCPLRVKIFYAVVISSLIVGGLTGLTQTRIRSLLTFSSINHVGWLITGVRFSLRVGGYYFMIYFMTLLCSIAIFHMFNVSHVRQLPLLNFKPRSQLLLFFALLSLGGLPPFLGFLPKWIVLQLAISYSIFLTAGIIVGISLLVLYFYLRLIFSSFIVGGLTYNTLNKDPLSLPVMFSTTFLISCGGLFLVYFM